MDSILSRIKKDGWKIRKPGWINCHDFITFELTYNLLFFAFYIIQLLIPIILKLHKI
jgi:hypothetical protein